MKCTFLRNRSLKSFVVLVVFSFSLVVACISPVWASSTVAVSDGRISLYCAVPTANTLYDGERFVLPTTSANLVKSYPAWNYPNATFGLQLGAYDFKPFDFDVTLYCAYSIMSSSFIDNATVSLNNSETPLRAVGSTDSFRGGHSPSAAGNFPLSYSFGPIVWSDSGQHYASYRPLYLTLPSGTDSFEFYHSMWKGVVIPSDWGVYLLSSYLIYSADHDVVKLVQSILSEVKDVNGNLTSALSVLNQILAQCQGIKADTSSIVSILGLCKDQLVSLNGKVDDIYTLLKDSLATESQALDQKSENVAGQIMQRVDSEQYWSDKNTENFNALDMGNWSFGDGVVGALPTVGNLFKSLWDSIGDVTLIFVFPLMLGIALVIVGRLSRTSGKGSKKGGGEDG